MCCDMWDCELVLQHYLTSGFTVNSQWSINIDYARLIIDIFSCVLFEFLLPSIAFRLVTKNLTIVLTCPDNCMKMLKIKSSISVSVGHVLSYSGQCTLFWVCNSKTVETKLILPLDMMLTLICVSALSSLRKWPRGLTDTIVLLSLRFMGEQQDLEAYLVPRWVISTSARRRGRDQEAAGDLRQADRAISWPLAHCLQSPAIGRGFKTDWICLPFSHCSSTSQCSSHILWFQLHLLTCFFLLVVFPLSAVDQFLIILWLIFSFLVSAFKMIFYFYQCRLV